MGFILSKFRKAGDSPSTKLEAISKELAEIEAYRRQNLARQKKTAASLVIYSILLYLVAAILYFVYYFPVLTLKHKLIHSLPLLIFPALIYGIKKFLHWYFVKRITENDLKLAELKEEKNKIIEDVMENETYKKATEILEKYAPNRLRILNESKDSSSLCSPGVANSSRVQSPTPGSELRLRANTAPLNASAVGTMQGGATPMVGLNRTLQGRTPGPMNTPGAKMTMQQRSMYGAPPGPPLPRQVLPRERSYVDKLFESLVGDGPHNRYALICRHCLSHNGMALSEEFEFLGFRCCYCFHMNEARKQRPNAPRLNLDTTVGSTSEEDEAVEGGGGFQESDESESETSGSPVVETQTIGEPTELAAHQSASGGSDISQLADNGDKKDN